MPFSEMIHQRTSILTFLSTNVAAKDNAWVVHVCVDDVSPHVVLNGEGLHAE